MLAEVGDDSSPHETSWYLEWLIEAEVSECRSCLNCKVLYAEAQDRANAQQAGECSSGLSVNGK